MTHTGTWQVMASFEGRMNDREEVEVARLLEDSVGSMSLNDSATNSNSPARYGCMPCHVMVFYCKAQQAARTGTIFQT